MGLSDCIKCWQTPCECGHQYEGWSIERKLEMVKAVMGKDEAEIMARLNL